MLPQQKIFIGLVVADAGSKLLAHLLLQPNQEATASALLDLVLRVNPVGLGSSAQTLLAFSQGYSELGFVSCLCFGFGALLLVLSYRQWLSARTVTLSLIGTLVFVLALAHAFPSIATGGLGSIVVLRLSQCFLWVVIWTLSTARYWKVGALLFAAAGTGNFLSFLYPPYGVIDFLWSPFFNRAIGLGVFNLADMFWIAGIAVFFLAARNSALTRLLRQTGPVPP